MYNLHTRMNDLHRFLTGKAHYSGWRGTYPPRQLWGEHGSAEERARAPRLFLTARLLWW